MTENVVSTLKQIYSNSGIPTVITDQNLNVIWRSSLASDKSILSGSSAAHLFEHGKPVCGTVCQTEGNSTIHRFNVMKFQNDGSEQPYYIIEHISSNELKDLLKSPDVKNYFAYLCARIRESANAIAISTDEIDSAVMYFSNGREDITYNLNKIYKNMMLILREVINPEQVYYTLDPYCNDSIICIEDELNSAAADISLALGSTSLITPDPEKGLFVRMNRSVFETITANMTAACCSGNLFPDEIVISSKRILPERVLITIQSVNTTGRKNTPSKTDYMKASSKLYADYLCSVMSQKYGAVFNEKQLDDGIEYSMEINALPPGRQIVMNDVMYGLRRERFSTTTLTLSEHRLEDRYTCIDIDN